MGQETMNLSKLCSKENQEFGEHKHYERKGQAELEH